MIRIRYSRAVGFWYIAIPCKPFPGNDFGGESRAGISFWHRIRNGVAHYDA